MRINVYHEEMMPETEVVEKYVQDTDTTYYGARIYLESSPVLHSTAEDDDRSAITFWFGEFADAMLFCNDYRVTAARIHPDKPVIHK